MSAEYIKLSDYNFASLKNGIKKINKHPLKGNTMKTFLKTLVAALAFTALAKADHLGTFDMTYDNYKRIELSECQGYVTVSGYSDSLVMKVYGNNNCSRVKVNGQTMVSDEGYFSGDRYLTVSINLSYGYNTANVVITSKTGKTQDRFTLTKDRRSQQGPVLGDEDWAYLSYCQGYAKFDVQNGQANLKLKGINLNKCQTVNISGDGDYRSYDLRSENSSFTVPKSMIDYGSNRVKVSFTSRYGDTVDRMTLKFRAY